MNGVIKCERLYAFHIFYVVCIDIKGYCYQKENQYYVLSMISENRQEIDTHASQVKGILKTYKVSKDTTVDILLQNLAKGVTHD